MNELCKLFGNVKGKVNRKEFISGLFLLAGLSIIPKLLSQLGVISSDFILLIFYIIIGLISFIFGLILVIKRTHDIGIKRYYSIIATIPFIGYLYIIYLFFKKGVKQENVETKKLVQSDIIKISIMIVISLGVYISVFVYSFLEAGKEERDAQRIEELSAIGTHIDSYVEDKRSEAYVTVQKHMISIDNTVLTYAEEKQIEYDLYLEKGLSDEENQKKYLELDAQIGEYRLEIESQYKEEWDLLTKLFPSLEDISNELKENDLYNPELHSQEGCELLYEVGNGENGGYKISTCYEMYPGEIMSQTSQKTDTLEVTESGYIK
ncbi:MAG: DUF805 domain-containing protein [Candidatus Gracilibacteria bacterium]|nr:DUF805 domain-containing protein [Candidatus Gracilibacteria bacterium]